MSKDMKILMTEQAADAIEDQEMMDLITAALQALQNGEEMPEGVELVNCGDGLSNEDIVAIMAGYEGKRSEDDLNAMMQALVEGDMEEFMSIAESEPRKFH